MGEDQRPLDNVDVKSAKSANDLETTVRDESRKQHPIVALGQCQGNFFFLGPDGQIRNVSGASLEAGRSVRSLLEGVSDEIDKWCLEMFPDGDGWSPKSAGLWIIRNCNAAGLFDPSHADRRLLGVWRSHEGRAVAHCGDHLVFDCGAKRKVPEIRGSEIYEACVPIKAPCFEGLRDEEIKELQNLFHRLWGWEDPDDADIVLGWTALAALGGFPNWRVHAYLSGPRGSGKSGFLEIIGLLLGELAGEVINDVTEAGLRQQRNNHARPMLIDEFEVEAGLRSASNQQAVFAMSRRMSGGQGGRIARGTADHRPVSFRVSGQVFFASINQRQLEPQDSSRFIQIKLRQLPDLVPVEAVQLFERLRQLASMVSSRFRGHMLAASPRYDCTLLQLKARVREAGADTRMADTIAAVLTGIDLLLHRTAIDEARLADYEGLIRSFISRTDDNADSEGQDALEHLLHAIVPMDHGWRRSVSELVDAVLERDDAFSDPDGSRAAIERVGIFVMKEKGQIALLSSRSSPVADLFRQSKWQGGAYISALLQLDGVMRPKSAVRLPNKSQKRAILIPLSYVRPVEVAKPSVTGCSGTV